MRARAPRGGGEAAAEGVGTVPEMPGPGAEAGPGVRVQRSGRRRPPGYGTSTRTESRCGPRAGAGGWFNSLGRWGAFGLGGADLAGAWPQVIVEKAEKSDIPDIDKKKCGLWAALGAPARKFGSAGGAQADGGLCAQVLGARRLNGGPVCVRHPQTHQSQPREGHLYVREERVATHRSAQPPSCCSGPPSGSDPCPSCCSICRAQQLMHAGLQRPSCPTCTTTTRMRMASCTSHTAERTPLGQAVWISPDALGLPTILVKGGVMLSANRCTDKI